MSRSDRKTTTARHPLLREAAATLALLADEEDFAAMRDYPPFTALDGHRAYLRQTEDALRALAARDGHTTVALLDPDRFHAYCAEHGIDPAKPASRARYTAELAAAGATVPYDGQPVGLLVPQLVDAAERRAGLEVATMILAAAGDCPGCGEDIGRTACSRASHALLRLVGAAGPGDHHLVCSVPAGPAPLTAALHAERGERGGLRSPEAETMLFCSVLAAGIATGAPGGVVLRTSVPDGRDRVRGWALRDAWLRPLTAAEVFSAYCTDPGTGEPVAPEPGVDHLPGFDLPEPDGCCGPPAEGG
ncbi:hypothetical protein ACH437_28770 [Streptomyces xinghaiensis]|uniref:hypothetical protein n=1 Tax=Streptomyces xinghaiensis TaxID=1038928 RepID=UPI0037BC25BD